MGMMEWSREKHYREIDYAFEQTHVQHEDQDFQFRVLARAQLHATLLVEKAIRERRGD